MLSQHNIDMASRNGSRCWKTIIVFIVVPCLVICLENGDQYVPSTKTESSSYDHYHHPFHNNDTFQHHEEVKKSLDWAQVERDFDRVLADEEVLQRWNSMETSMKTGMRVLLRSIFPKVVAMATDAKVSGNCSAGILKWIVSLRNMKTWAMKMFDAIGKPPSGIFEGVVTMFGNYDQCLAIRVYEDDEENDSALEGDTTFLSTPQNEPTMSEKPPESLKEFFRGQYCVAEFKPWLPAKPRFYGMNSRLKTSMRNDDSVFTLFSKMAVFFHFISFRIDLCVPSTCTRDDIQRVTSLMANLIEFRSRVTRCETTRDSSSISFPSLIFASVIACLSILVMLSTLKDASSLQLPWLPTYFIQVIQVFSLTRNWKIFGDLTSLKQSKLSALNGARVLVILWIVAAHTFIQLDYQFMREMQTLKSFASRWWAQIFTNSVFQFDCLLLISAFAFGYYNIDNGREKVLRYLAKRCIKIIVLMAFLMLLVIALPAILPAGPVMNDFVAAQAQSCRQDWWLNLLYLQSYFPTQCLPVTWIFSVELQLSLLAIVLLTFYNSLVDNKTGRFIFWLAFPILLLFGFVYNFTRVYHDQLPPTYYWTLPDKQQRTEYFGQYYHRPLAHLSVYIVGFYAGAYRKLSNSKKKIIFNEPNIYTIGHFLSVFTIVCFTFGFNDWATGDLPNAFISGLYAAAHRVCLSLSLAWILFCVSDETREASRGHSIFRRFLATDLLGRLDKLSLTAFLVLPLVQTSFLASQQQHLYSSWLLLVYIMLGNTVFTYLLALSLNLLLELPVRIVMQTWLKYLFHQLHRLRPAKSQDTNNTSFDNKLRDNSSTNLCPTNIEIASYTFKN